MKLTFEEYLKKNGVVYDNIKEAPALYTKHLSEYNTHVRSLENEERQKELKGKADLSELEALKKLQAEKDEKINELEIAVKAQGIAMNKQTSADKENSNLKSSISVISEKASEIVKSHKQGGGDLEFTNFTQKADTTTASVADNARAFDLDTIGQLATRRTSALDFFIQRGGIIPPSADGKIRYIDWDESTKVRAAAMMAEGGIFPESTAAWETKSLPLKKIGDSLPWTDEFEYDVQFLVNELGRFLTTNVGLIADTQIVNGDGTGNNLTGLFTSVPAYTAVASGITDASIYDLFIKVSESITATGGSKYSPDFALMNIVDINKYRLKKDANNNYVMPPFVSADGNVIAGMTVIESNAVTANSMVIGDSMYASVYGVPGFGIETGYINDDFTKGKKRMRLYRRMLFLIREVDKTGFKKVADIDASLVLLATP